MKEQTKKVILLVVICVVTLGVLIVALKLHENKQNDLLSKSDISNYLTEINYEEIANHVVEQPSTIIYVSNSSEESTNNFDEIFIPVIKKYNLENDVIYININNETIIDPVYQYAPELVFYEQGEISDIIDCTTLKTSNDVIKELEERSVIGD
jgi:hypothetical protein